MKKGWFIGSLAVVGILMISAHLSAQRMHAARYYYDSASVVTVTGEVTAVESATRGWANYTGTHLVITTGNGPLTVYAGPSSFLEGKMSFAKGDRIEVTGSRTDTGGRPGIVAREIAKGNEKVVVRNRDGSPLWAGQGSRGRW